MTVNLRISYTYLFDKIKLIITFVFSPGTH